MVIQRDFTLKWVFGGGVLLSFYEVDRFLGGLETEFSVWEQRPGGILGVDFQSGAL